MLRADDDDDAPEHDPDTWKRDAIVAVAVAGVSAVIVGLGEWALHELRERFGSKPSSTPPSSADDSKNS